MHIQNSPNSEVQVASKNRLRKAISLSAILDRIKYQIKPFVENNRTLQDLGFRVFCRFPQLLPHDQNYFGAKLLIDLLLKQGIQPNIIDVGGNIGLSALSFRKFSKTAIIHSFEPLPYNYKYIQSLANRDSRIKAYSFAVGSQNIPKISFFVPRIGGRVFHTMGNMSLSSVKKPQKWFFIGKNCALLSSTPMKCN